MTTTTTEPALDVARRHLAELTAEAEALPERIDAAKRAGDAGRWMALQVRADEIPAEVVAAECTTLAHESTQAWADAEAGLVVEAERRQVADVKRAAYRVVSKPVVGQTLTEMAERAIEIDAAAAEVRAAEGELAEAMDVVGWALLTAERAEARMVELGSDADKVLTDREGVRALPRPVNGNVILVVARFGSLSDELASEGTLLEAGSVPPRWIAHRLGAHLFEDPEPTVALGLATGDRRDNSPRSGW